METVKKMMGLKVSETLPAPTEAAVQETRENYDKAGQGHVFAFWDKLSVVEQTALYGQLSEIDPHSINQVVESAKSAVGKEEAELSPLPKASCATTIDSDKEEIKGWYDRGIKLIAHNKVAVVVMAGGQGTRLGSSDPKGCFDIGLPSGKSLFQLQAERIAKVQRLAQKQESPETVTVVPWYIMTSTPTRQATEDFYTEHSYFGLDSENVMFFDQGTLPCLDTNDKIILETKSSISVAPDGNGGIYRALVTGGVLEDMERRGVEHVQVYCVDNCLAKVADPVFFGWASEKKLDLATKVVRKRNPEESVGLVVLRGGKPDVVEYSEIDKKVTEEKDKSGLLRYRAANIVQHYYSSTFLADAPRWSTTLQHHIAKKKIPYCDTETGEKMRPESPNGIKLEQFVFDVFPLAKLDKFGCLEVVREDEFSPLKNASGDDSAESSRRDLMSQGVRWVKAAGGVSVDDGSGEGRAGVEISPLVSYGGEGLAAHVDGQEIRGRAYIAPRTT